MTAQADPIYLPVISPVRIGVGVRTFLEQRTPARESLRPRIYRVPPRSANEGLRYGPDAILAQSPATGLEIDLFV